MKRYCRKCGNEIDDNYVCPCCNELLAMEETIHAYTVNARVGQLHSMHDLMLNANDETIYMSWINYMPDEATESDFRDIAFDDEEYERVFDAFVRLIAKKGNRY